MPYYGRARASAAMIAVSRLLSSFCFVSNTGPPSISFTGSRGPWPTGGGILASSRPRVVGRREALAATPTASHAATPFLFKHAPVSYRSSPAGCCGCCCFFVAADHHHRSPLALAQLVLVLALNRSITNRVSTVTVRNPLQFASTYVRSSSGSIYTYTRTTFLASVSLANQYYTTAPLPQHIAAPP